MEDDLFEDWFSDNRIELMSDFIENRLDSDAQEKWSDYQREQFEIWKETRC